MHKNITRILISLLALPALGWGDDAQSPAPANPNERDIPVEELQTFGQIYRLILDHHVNTYTPEELMQAASRGLVAGLDPHSEYLLQSTDEDKSAFGLAEDVGVNLALTNNGVVIASVLPDSAASRSGIQPGDILLKLNDRALSGVGLADIRQQLGGKVGSIVELEVLRQTQKLSISLKRIKYDETEVGSELLNPEYGVIRIRQFTENTPGQFEHKLSGLLKASQGLQGLIIDVRGNPGGVLNAAIAIADYFLNDGPMIAVVGRSPTQELPQRQMFFATAGDVLRGIPIAVLVDGGTASAAEVLALALQQGKRGIVVGTPTRGKGSVQTLFPLSEGKSLKLTTGYYQDVQGNSIHLKGVALDFQVVFPHISEGIIAKDDGTALAYRDYSLFEAVNALKIINRLNSN